MNYFRHLGQLAVEAIRGGSPNVPLLAATFGRLGITGSFDATAKELVAWLVDTKDWALAQKLLVPSGHALEPVLVAMLRASVTAPYVFSRLYGPLLAGNAKLLFLLTHKFLLVSRICGCRGPGDRLLPVHGREFPKNVWSPSPTGAAVRVNANSTLHPADCIARGHAAPGGYGADFG